MLKFDNNHIITGEIKQFLKEFNLPQVKVWKEGMPIFSGCFYIYGQNLYVGAYRSHAPSGYSRFYLKLIGPYIYGKEMPNITKNLIIDSLLYDSYTHKYFGDYLRFYRDMKGINLMSMYNCFSNELCKKLELSGSFVAADETTISYDFDTTNDNFKIYMIPVKWFENYTIGIDCDTQIELIVGMYDNDRLITVPDGYSDALYKATYTKMSGVRLSNPFLFTKLAEYMLDYKRMYLQEPNLKLFIKVPSTSNSSIAVLEGDFTKNTQLHFDNINGFATLSVGPEICNYETGTVYYDDDPILVYNGANTERQYLSRLQLMDFNSTVSYPFSDRLIEYIFSNVITSDDEISENIERLQKRLVQRYSTYIRDKNGNLVHKYIGMPTIANTPSTWSTKIRNVCYDIVLNSDIASRRGANKFDLIGFVDKETEQEIGEYVEVNN